MIMWGTGGDKAQPDCVLVGELWLVLREKIFT